MKMFLQTVVLIIGFKLVSSALIDEVERALPILDSFEIEPEQIAPIFNLLESYGKQFIENMKEDMKDNFTAGLKQFIAVAVISHDELAMSKEWTIDDLESKKPRVRVYINEVRKGHKKPLHGEMQFLYEDQGLSMMLNALNKADEETPYAIIFTHYIPCAHIKHHKYSCSEELANAAFANNAHRFKMILAYNEVYDETDEGKSREFMKTGSIHAFKKLLDNVSALSQYQQIYELQSDAYAKTSFQQHFYKCLLDKPVSDCCLANRKETKSQIVAYFVNTITYTCAHTSKSYGLLTKWNRSEFCYCIWNYIEKNIGIDCHQCTNKADIQSVVQFCALNAIGFAPAFGMPSFDPYAAKWTDIYRGQWKDIYNNYNFAVEENRPRLPCLKQDNDKKSLCTKSLKRMVGEDLGIPDSFIGTLRSRLNPHKKDKVNRTTHSYSRNP